MKPDLQSSTLSRRARERRVNVGDRHQGRSREVRVPDDLSDRIAGLRFAELPVTIAHSIGAGGQPRHHRDPFDRMLVAQAADRRPDARHPRRAACGVRGANVSLKLSAWPTAAPCAPFSGRPSCARPSARRGRGTPRAERDAGLGIGLDERAGDAVPHRAGLPGGAASVDADADVVRALGLRHLQRRGDLNRWTVRGSSSRACGR